MGCVVSKARNQGVLGGVGKAHVHAASTAVEETPVCPHCKASGASRVPVYCTVRSQESAATTRYRKCKSCGIGFKCVHLDAGGDVRVSV
jgi:transcription elongation factor Elf1